LTDPTKSRQFREIALPHLDAAYNLARWLTRNDHDAEDVVQEAFLRAFRSLDGFRGASGRPWLLAIVRNACYDWLRQNRRGELDVAYDDDLHGDVRTGTTTLGAGPIGDPESLLARTDDRRLINEALEKLPVEFREVVVLRDVEDLSYKEIAAVAAIPIGTVMSRLSRGRKMMLTHLARRMPGGPDGM